MVDSAIHAVRDLAPEMAKSGPRKQRETARIETEAQAERLAAVLRDSSDAIILSTPDGRITAWNRGAARAYGYSEADALELNMREITPEPHRASIDSIAARVARGEEIEPFESQRLTRAGRVLDVWVTLTALRDESGRIVALARTERDITARRAAEAEILRLNAELEQRVAHRTAALTDSERRIRAILGAAVDAIITIDADGRIETFNSAAEAMFGYSAAEAIGRNVSILMASPYREGHDDYLRRYARTRKPRVIGRVREFRARRKDGTDFPIQLSVSEIPDLGLFTGIIRDITEQRRLQEEIVRAAGAEQRRIGEELHDTTQQELTGLGLLAQNLADALEGSDAAAERELAAKLATGIASTNQHVRALAQGLVPVPVDAEGLMLALEKLAERTDEAHDLRCRFVCPEPVRIADDNIAQHLYRIAHEAVTNAIKHAGAKTISIRLEHKDGALHVAVRDDGIGIDEGRNDHEGLGLRIMEHRCGLMGGTFSARRGEAGGTVISCKVPVVGAE